MSCHSWGQQPLALDPQPPKYDIMVHLAFIQQTFIAGQVTHLKV